MNAPYAGPNLKNSFNIKLGAYAVREKVPKIRERATVHFLIFGFHSFKFVTPKFIESSSCNNRCVREVDFPIGQRFDIHVFRKSPQLENL